MVVVVGGGGGRCLGRERRPARLFKCTWPGLQKGLAASFQASMQATCRGSHTDTTLNVAIEPTGTLKPRTSRQATVGLCRCQEVLHATECCYLAVATLLHASSSLQHIESRSFWGELEVPRTLQGDSLRHIAAGSIGLAGILRMPEKRSSKTNPPRKMQL